MKICSNKLNVIFTVLLLFLSTSHSKFLDNLYHSVEEIYYELDMLESGACKGTLKKESIKSDEGSKSMTYYKLNSQDKLLSKKNKVVMIFGEHSRELVSSEQGLYLIRVLCKQVPLFDQETVNAILRKFEFVIVPIVNEYGRERVEGGDYCWRTNENGVDINRNWDSHWKKDESLKDSNQYPGDHPFSEWESQALSKLIRQNNPEIFISTHAGTLGMYTPFAYKKFEFDELDESDSRKLSNMLRIIKTVNSKYCNCKAGAIGNELWYLCPGTCLDYAYEHLQIKYTFAFEIYDGFSTNAHFTSILNDPDLKPFNYKQFLEENSYTVENHYPSNTLFLQTKTKLRKNKPDIKPVYERLSYHVEKNHNESCFSQLKVEQLDLEECKKQMNPLNELHLKNTLINWVNVYFELFALIALNE